MKLLIKIGLVFFFTNVWGQSHQIKPVFQTGHNSKINKLRFHPDNKTLVSISDDGKVIVWDVNLGFQRQSIQAHQGGVRDFDFLTDTSIVTVGFDHHMCIWSIPDLELIKRLGPFADNIESVTRITDSTVCMASNLLYIYNLNTEISKQFSYSSNGKFTALDYSNLREEIAVGGPNDNYAVTIAVNENSKFTKYLIDKTHRMRFHDPGYLFFANTNGTLRYYDYVKNKRFTYTLNDDINYVSDMAYCNNRIALSTAFGYALIIDPLNHSTIKKLGINGIALTSIDFSGDGKWLATADVNGIIYLYDSKNFTINRILKSAAAWVVDVKLKGENMYVGYSNGVLRKINLVSNQITSNSIKLDAKEESDGINYSILSIDSLNEDELYFTTLRTNRHHVQTSKLSAAVKLKCKWYLNDNLITILKRIDHSQTKKYVDSLYNSKGNYQIEDFISKTRMQEDNGNRFDFKHGAQAFYRIIGNDTSYFETKHEGAILGLALMPDKEIILSYSKDGSIRFWDYNGNYLSCLYLSGQYNFVYFNDDNYYFASKQILNKLGFLYRQKLFSYEQYDLFYNRPDLVLQKLPFLTDNEISLYKKAYKKRLEKLGVSRNELNISDSLPIISVDYLGEYSTKLDSVLFIIDAIGTNADLKSYSYIINGIENSFKVKENQKTIQKKIEIALSPGINQIEFYCINKLDIKSLVDKTVVSCEKKFEKPNLYIVSIGVSGYKKQEYDLKYAKKDASEIETLFAHNKKYNNIYQKSYLDKGFTLDKLTEIDTFLSQAKTNDVVVLFYAGHGILDQNLDYYLATYDMDFNLPELRGVKFDDFERLVENLSCRNKLVLLDACYSGEIDKSAVIFDSEEVEQEEDIIFRSAGINIKDGDGLKMGILELSKLLFVDMRLSQGSNIISSASGTEYAIEGDEWENGLFTFVLKKAIIDKLADLNGDKSIEIMELQIYLRGEVSTLSGGKQNPLSRKENAKNNFIIW